MEKKVEVIYFLIKTNGVKGLVFVQITFKKCITNFYFEGGKVGIETTVDNLELVLVWNFSAFFVALFSIRTCFYETTNVFYLEYQTYFQKLLVFSESSIKIKVKSLFVILLTSAVISKQKILHGNKIAKYLQNWKCYNFVQGHFRKPL